MGTTLSAIERVRRALVSPTRGVIGIADDLVVSASELGLGIEWREGHCRLRWGEPDSKVTARMYLPKSVFRAVLARIAALCNERYPNSVSSYGGSGTFSTGARAEIVYQVTFSNTPADQRLELKRESHAS